MPNSVTSADPVRKSVTVPAAPQRAFELFTAHFHEWWPLATHSVGIEDAVSVAFGQEAGAAITETMADGTTCRWGTITRWEPPYRVAFSWHPGTPPTEATSVEVTFTPSPSGPGSTVVRLVHSGWERRPDGAAAREGYDSGWDPVISAFATAARLPAAFALVRGHQPGLVGQHDGLDPVAQAELGQHPADVSLDGALLDHQVGGNLGIGQAPRDEPQHVYLAGGQLGRDLGRRRGGADRPGEAGDQPPGDARVDVTLSFAPDCLELRVAGLPAAGCELRQLRSTVQARLALFGGTIDIDDSAGRRAARIRLPLVTSHA